MEKYDENGNLMQEYYDKRNGLWYALQGDYYYPMIAVPKQEKVILGKYGRARLNYIKTHKRGLYAELLMNGTLNKHLAEIDKTATERINRIIKAMAEQDNTNEQLKETNQLLWVGLMNNYKHSTEEIVYNEIIFS